MNLLDIGEDAIRQILLFIQSPRIYLNIIRTNKLMYRIHAQIIYDKMTQFASQNISLRFYTHGEHSRSIYRPYDNIEIHEAYRSGIRHGRFVIYKGDICKEFCYENGSKEGICRKYEIQHNDRTNKILIAEYNYKSDKKDGLYKHYSNWEGTVGKVIGETIYKRGLRQEQKEYYLNGQLEEHILYENNEMNGEYKSYFEDGIINSQGYYKDDMLHGEFRVYDKDGKLLSITTYEKGMKNGEYQQFNKKGQLVIHCFYKDGLCQFYY